jgi:3D (Asp-Asp-Asp) domain-containing protein
MRRSRRLTESERWELGLFLAILVIGCVSLAALFRMDAIPRLFAAAFGSQTASPNASVSPPADPVHVQPSLLEIGPAAPAVPLIQPQRAAPVQPLSISPRPSLPGSAPDTEKPRVAKKPVEDIRYYNGRKYRYVKTLRLRVTAYAPDARCCWPYPGTTTASGLSVKTNHGRLVAADTNLIPMHALVSVPGYSNGAAVPVLDRGGAIKGHRLDVLLPTFEKAKDWGSRVLQVKVYMPVN